MICDVWIINTYIYKYSGIWRVLENSEMMWNETRFLRFRWVGEVACFFRSVTPNVPFVWNLF